MDRKERYERFKLKQKRILNMAVAVFFLVSVLVLSVVSILKPDKEFSAEENRVLTQRPDFSVENVQSEEYMS